MLGVCNILLHTQQRDFATNPLDDMSFIVPLWLSLTAVHKFALLAHKSSAKSSQSLAHAAQCDRLCYKILLNTVLTTFPTKTTFFNAAKR